MGGTTVERDLHRQRVISSHHLMFPDPDFLAVPRNVEMSPDQPHATQPLTFRFLWTGSGLELGCEEGSGPPTLASGPKLLGSALSQALCAHCLEHSYHMGYDPPSPLLWLTLLSCDSSAAPRNGSGVRSQTD